MQTALRDIAAAFEDPGAVAARGRAEGRRIVRHIGTDIPLEMLVAAGLSPVRLAALDTAEAAGHDADLGWRGRSMLRQLRQADTGDAILITHANAELPQFFAALRDVGASRGMALGPAHLLDLLHLPKPGSERYNRIRLAALRDWLEELSGRPLDDLSIQGAIGRCNEQKRLLAHVAAYRRGPAPRLAGGEMLRLIGAASILPLDEHMALTSQLLSALPGRKPLAGRRLLVTGSLHETARLYDDIEGLGAIVVGESHGWGDPWHEQRPDPSLPWIEALARPDLRSPLPVRSVLDQARSLAARCSAAGAEAVLHINIEGDEAAPWEAAALRRAARAHGLPFLSLDLSARGLGDGPARDRLLGFLADFRSEDARARPAAAGTPAAPRRREGGRSRKSLASVADFGSFQREWFADLRQRVAAGEPFGIMNANAPQEILRALGIPFVVNQWWASIVAAKQQSGRYVGLLEERFYPTEVDAYSSQGLAALFDEDADHAPWGGLPHPDFLFALTSSDATPKIFENWAAEADAELYLFERTVEPRWSVSSEWWEELPDRWDEALESVRLDLLVGELEEAIGDLEQRTGRVFDRERFAEIMTLVNEQEDYYRKTRDLIAATVPAPVSIVDTMPATMVPQWHRGSVWARDAARAFYEEVARRAAEGKAACEGEKIRLMFVGRGLWGDMGFYQRWEESHGAVFVCSMYLSLAADGYIRHFDRGRDPMRALAARVMTMGDELRMPNWAGAWHVKDALAHGVDGAIALSDADPIVLRELAKAGFPVLELGIDNYNPDSVDAALTDRRIRDFLEGPAAAKAEARRRSAP